MPEGPSIIILKEELLHFTGQKILEAGGNSKIGIGRLEGQKVVAFKSWGKHLLICFKDFTVRIHLMLFGSYRVDEPKDASPRLYLRFANGEVYFYSCAIKIIEGDINDVYDWEVDIMSASWNPQKAITAIKQQDEAFVCDILLDQNIFAGSGNIIKNEVLFITRIHPLTLASALPAKKLKELVNETQQYSIDFYYWKRLYELKKHWLAYKQKICPRCAIPFLLNYLGKNKRRTFYCENCQLLYK